MTLLFIILEFAIEWISGDNTLQSNWSVTAEDSALYLQTQLTQPDPFKEVNDRPMDGIAYISIQQVRFPSQYLCAI